MHHPLRTVPELQQALQTSLPLQDCLVLAATEVAGTAPWQINWGATARYLDDRIDDESVIGVGWGSTVYHVVTSGYLHRKRGVSVVQMMGSVGGATPDIDGGQVASRLGQALGPKVFYLQAPMVVTDAAVRAGLLRDPHIRQTLETARRADVLLVSVGAVTEATDVLEVQRVQIPGPIETRGLGHRAHRNEQHVGAARHLQGLSNVGIA